MNKKNMVIYTIISYVWSYTFWLIAIIMAISSKIDIYINEALVEAFYTNLLSGKVGVLSFLALVAVFGPLIASIVLSAIDSNFKKSFLKRVNIYKKIKYYFVVIAIFLAIGFVPSVPLIFIEGFSSMSFSRVLLYLFTFMVIQLITSGTEEFGWRGFLLPEFLKENSVWDASFKTGIIWAFWHTPIVLYIFYLQGMPIFAMLFSFVGFSVGIVAMSVVHSYFFIKTKSVLFSVYLHAMSNTIPLIAGLLILDSYKTAIFAQLLIWLVVYIIMKKNPDMFPKKVKEKL